MLPKTRKKQFSGKKGMVPEGGFVRLSSQVLLLPGTLYNASQRTQTGAEMVVADRKVLLFRLSGVLNDKINE